MSPFLDPQFAIRWSQLTPEHIEPDIRTALAEARNNVAKIVAQDLTSLSYESTVWALEKATESLHRGWGRLNHLNSVADAPAQRAALNAMLPEVSEFFSSLYLNPDLWQVIKSYATSAAVATLSPLQQRHVAETVRDFQDSGADLAEPLKRRLAEIDAALAHATKRYAENVLDATNAWSLVITDAARLRGLPESAIAAAAANAKAKQQQDGSEPVNETPAWRFTLHQPSMAPIMQHADDDELRREVWQASIAVGAAEPFDNAPLAREILSLREEKALILGHAHFADLTLQRRMARTGAQALAFIEDLHQRVATPFAEEHEALRQLKCREQGLTETELEPWEFSYWAEKRRKQLYDFDDEQLRPYFPVDSVMAGMFDLASTLFGVRITEQATVYLEPGSAAASSEAVEVWHPEVRFYALHDNASGEHLGSFYADWHPREPKSGGAWMNQLTTGSPPQDGQPRQPHLGLIVGNMSPPIDGQPALLTHREVETVFHEFGHLLHGLLSDVSVPSLGGTNVPWDFVELPSQLMENFCWTRESLDLFARHHLTGEPIPEDLYQKMHNARHDMSATAFMRQLAFGKLDLELHMHWSAWQQRSDLDALERELLKDYRTAFKTTAPGMFRRFNHLFSSPTGYAAGYYSYKWAEVLDADAFTRFETEGLLNPATGHDFRAHILSQGNSQPVEQLYRNFMGRDPELDPLLRRSGLKTAATH